MARVARKFSPILPTSLATMSAIASLVTLVTADSSGVDSGTYNEPTTNKLAAEKDRHDLMNAFTITFCKDTI